MHILARARRHVLALAVLFAVSSLAMLACASSETRSPQIDPTPTSLAVDNSGCATTLCCPDCELVDVMAVQNGELLTTPGGTLRMYGAYVDMQSEMCAGAAKERMSELAGSQVRIERVDGRDTDSRGRQVAYLYAASGDSIDEIMVQEGLARAWTQDGQHSGWFVYRQSVAASTDSGCIWNLGPLGR